MKKYYFTFGQSHTHSFNGMTLDKDIVMEIEAKDSNSAREIMFGFFGDKWSMQYNEKPNMDYFPRGILSI